MHDVVHAWLQERLQTVNSIFSLYEVIIFSISERLPTEYIFIRGLLGSVPSWSLDQKKDILSLEYVQS